MDSIHVFCFFVKVDLCSSCTTFNFNCSRGGKKPNRYQPYGVGVRGHGESFPGKLRENAWYG